MMMPKKEKKPMPITVMVAVGKPSKAMPVRGSRTAKSKASKAKKAK
jgi:hypothetical protein